MSLGLSSAAWSQGRSGGGDSGRPGDSGGAGGTVVLDTYGFWRLHHTLAPPLLEGEGGLKPALLPQKWLNAPTPAPPAGWREANFDDAGWVRSPAPTACRTPYLQGLCLRGKFRVTDPGRIRDLRLTLAFSGGAAAWLNGKELARDHAAANAKGEWEYSEGGAASTPRGSAGAGPASTPRGSAGAGPAQAMDNLAIPSNLLRPGVNVLAIQVLRPPFRGAAAPAGKEAVYALPAETCAVKSVQLRALSPDGLVPNASRPSGLQVWNSSVLASDFDADFGDTAEALAPVRLVGVRGGAFSGKVVVGSPRPLDGLKAVAGELKSAGGGVIPASAVTVRYALPWGMDPAAAGRGTKLYSGRATLLSALSEAPVSPAPAERPPAGRGQPPAAAFVVPVWITVNVPRDARPGLYTGAVRIEAPGEAPLAAPVALEVIDWALPAMKDRRVWVELIQSPDTLSVEYELPLWSDKHFALIGRSLDFVGQAAARTIYVPLIAHTNLGNAESMVRWIQKAPGQRAAAGSQARPTALPGPAALPEYEFDFTAMDKYLDQARKSMTALDIVVLQVWDIYMSSRQSAGKRFGEGISQSGMDFDRGPQVTVLEAATGKTRNVSLPHLGEAGSKALWQKLIGQVRERMRTRGLDKALMFGMFTDAGPTKEDVLFFQSIAPDLPWVQQGHGLYEENQKLHGIAPLGYQATVWGAKFCDGVPTHGTTDNDDLHGWRRRQLAVDFERNTGLDNYPSTRWRQFAETCITGNMRGLGRVGADYWRAVRDKTGRRTAYVHDRYPEGAWGIGGIYLNVCNPVLAPAAQGPVATQHFEVFREGLQECEARVFIEAALLDSAQRSRLGAELAKRCEDALGERRPIMWRGLSNLELIGSRWGDARLWRWTEGIAGHVWFLGSGWQERSDLLYSLAAEADKKLGPRNPPGSATK